MVRNVAKNAATATVAVLRHVVKGVAILSVIAVVVTGLYFIAEPFAAFGKWFSDNNVFPKALLLLLAPIAAALANQVKRNLSEQAKLEEPKSVKRAFNQATEEQVPEMVMGWISWLAFTAGAIALGLIVGLFQVPNCPM